MKTKNSRLYEVHKGTIFRANMYVCMLKKKTACKTCCK